MPFQTIVTTPVHFNGAWANVPGWTLISLATYITGAGPFGPSVLEHHVNGIGINNYYLHAKNFAGPGVGVVRLHALAAATPSGRMPIFAPPPAPPMGAPLPAHAPSGGG